MLSLRACQAVGEGLNGRELEIVQRVDRLALAAVDLADEAEGVVHARRVEEGCATRERERARGVSRSRDDTRGA